MPVDSLSHDLSQAIFLHPGQGTQRVGMGRWLFRRSARARSILALVDSISGLELERVLRGGPAVALDDTRYAQPAIFVTNLAAEAVLSERGVEAAATAGHSVGELSALVTAGVLDLESAARLVVRRGSLMASVKTKGAMGLVSGLDVSVLRRFCTELSADAPLVVALENAPSQVVVSGAPAVVAACLRRSDDAGATRTAWLRTSNAFHSPLMAGCRDRWAEAVEAVDLQPPRIPFAMNVSGRLSSDVDEMRQGLVDQLTAPVRWHGLVRTLDLMHPSAYVECGDSRYLASLNRAMELAAPTLCMDSERRLAASGVAA